MKVGIRIVEVLGDGGIGTGIHLALEVLQIVLGICRLGVNFRIGSHLTRTQF